MNKILEPRHAKRALRVYSKCLFSYFLNVHNLKIFENLSSIAVEISFLWDREHGVYAEPSFAKSVVQNFTSIFLYRSVTTWC